MQTVFPVYLKVKGFEAPGEPIYYLVTKDGLFQVKENAIFQSSVRVAGLDWLEPEREGVALKLPMIPGPLMGEIVAFFREVYRRHRAEAIVLLYFDPAGQRFTFEVPEQEVAGGHLAYAVGSTPPGLIRVGTIHSHAEAEAFHSELDDLDERHDDGLHITVGNLDGRGSISCSMVVDGRRFRLRAREVVEAIPARGPEPDLTGHLLKVHVEAVPRDSSEEGRPSAI